jgi:ATP-dependent exoDNAse (exonuclease V) alpha subunit
MTSLSHLLPALPGFIAPQTYAAWPVWSDSTTKPIRFAPMAKKAAVKLWHRARDFDRGTHQQLLAFRHVTQTRDLNVVVGYAGTGKSTMLGAAREAWEADGYQVRGAALSGIAAEQLEAGAGIASRTVHSLLFQWEQGREVLTDRDQRTHGDHR